MGIAFIATDVPGQITSPSVRRVKIITTDSFSTIIAAGYLNPASLEGYTIFNTDVLSIWYGATIGSGGTVLSPGTYGEFTASIANGIITLVQEVFQGNVLLPVVSGDIAIFNGTTGQIKDSGVSISGSSGTIPIVTTPTIANHIATYTNTTGTLSEDPATAISGGNIQAGLSGTAGTLASFPSAASKGSLIVAAVANTGNTNTTISNAAMGQASVISIPDPGGATSNFVLTNSAGVQNISSGSLQVGTGNLLSGSTGNQGTLQLIPTTASTGNLFIKAVPNSGNTNTVIQNAAFGQASTLTIPDPGVASSSFLLQNAVTNTQNIAGNITLNINPIVINKTVTATSAALATAGKVNIFVAPTVTAQISVLDIKVFFSTGLSGGGGNRLLSLADGTLVFNGTGITAALLGTPIFTLWGGTGNTLPSAVQATVSTAGANVYLQYIGGTTDYTTGSVIIAVTYAQVTT